MVVVIASFFVAVWWYFWKINSNSKTFKICVSMLLFAFILQILVDNSVYLVKFIG